MRLIEEQVIERNGKFYYYVPVARNSGGGDMAIGVVSLFYTFSACNVFCTFTDRDHHVRVWRTTSQVHIATP